MDEPLYTKRETDLLLQEIRTSLKNQEGQNMLILTQTTKTNGRVSRLERNMLIVACVVTTLLVTNGSEVINIIKLII